MYRTKEELEQEKEIDVVNSFPKFLVESKLFTADEVEAIRDEVTLECREALKRTLDTPMPGVETFEDHTYSERQLISLQMSLKRKLTFQVKMIFQWHRPST